MVRTLLFDLFFIQPCRDLVDSHLQFLAFLAFTCFPNIRLFIKYKRVKSIKNFPKKKNAFAFSLRVKASFVFVNTE